MRRRAAPLALLGVLALALAGCAIPTQSAPSELAPSKVPFNLLNPNRPTTTTTQPKFSAYVPVQVFFVNSTTQQLVSEPRVVTAPAQLTSILNTMLAGPTNAESAGGVVTALPSNVALLSVTTQGNVVTVNMNTAFGQITGTNAELAVAQVVATIATENGLGTGVVFEIDGKRTSVPVANGSQVAGPVYLIQFLGAPA